MGAVKEDGDKGWKNDYLFWLSERRRNEEATAYLWPQMGSSEGKGRLNATRNHLSICSHLG